MSYAETKYQAHPDGIHVKVRQERSSISQHRTHLEASAMVLHKEGEKKVMFNVSRGFSFEPYYQPSDAEITTKYYELAADIGKMFAAVKQLPVNMEA